MEGQRHWYVIHTYSGYENKVKLNLESKVHSLGMEDMIFQVLVPMQDELETKDDQQKVVSRKVFPGYVLIEMIVDDRSGTLSAIRRVLPVLSARAPNPFLYPHAK